MQGWTAGSSVHFDRHPAAPSAPGFLSWASAALWPEAHGEGTSTGNIRKPLVFWMVWWWKLWVFLFPKSFSLNLVFHAFWVVPSDTTAVIPSYQTRNLRLVVSRGSRNVTVTWKKLDAVLQLQYLWVSHVTNGLFSHEPIDKLVHANHGPGRMRQRHKVVVQHFIQVSWSKDQGAQLYTHIYIYIYIHTYIYNYTYIILYMIE